MKIIMIPTDFSENAWNALTFATALYANKKCRFILFHINPIVHTGGKNSVNVPRPVLKETVIKLSQEKLVSWKDKIKNLVVNHNHNFETLAVYDFFVDAIKFQLSETKVDLIVMGTKGAKSFKKVTIGSNTGHVITKIKHPILVVPENAHFKGLKQIMFPTDYHTGIAISVLDNLKELMDLNNSSLTIVHMVSRDDEKLSIEQNRNMDFLKDYFLKTNHSFKRAVGSRLEESIQSYADCHQMDMIVMVAKNQNFMQRILFRPLVEHISYHINTPFLVLHE